LIDGVGGAEIPVVGNAHLRRKNFEELAHADDRGPAAADVAIQAERFVLSDDEDAAEFAIQAIGKGDVDDAVDSAEGNGGLCAVARERPQALALASGKQYTDRFPHRGNANGHSRASGTSQLKATHSSSNGKAAHFGRNH